MLEVRSVEAMDEALLGGTCKEFLRKSVGRATVDFGAIVVAAGERMAANVGALKEGVLGSPEDGVACGM